MPPEWVAALGHRYAVVPPNTVHEDTTEALALDVDSRAQVVARLIPNRLMTAALRMRLTHDAMRLRGESSTQVQSLLDFSENESGLFFIWECVEGITLQTKLASGKLTLDEALALARSLFVGLDFYHQRGVRHGNLRSANLVHSQDGWKIVNFGTARGIDHGGREDVDQVARACYLSPEQSGSIPHDVGDPADLYSAGVVLFEGLAGELPFRGRTVGDVLFAHMTKAVPDLHAAGVPAAVYAVVQKLLCKDPRDRYQLAASVVSDLDKIGAAFRRGETEPRIQLGRKDRRQPLREAAFVGRESELGHLGDHMAMTREGRGGLVTLDCESGGGKSRLLLEAARRATQAGTWVLWGCGAQDVALRPLRLLDGVFQGLEDACTGNPKLRDTILAGLDPDDRAALATLPGLQRILGMAAAPASELPDEFGELRLLRGLTSLILALGDMGRAAAIFLDDCQWCDDFTWKFLRHWSRESYKRSRYGCCHVAVVATFRREDVDANHPLRTLLSVFHLALSPLGSADLSQIVQSMADDLPEDVVELVVDLAQGSPFMASAVLRGMVESGALSREAAGWRVDLEKRSEWQSSRDAATSLSRRIDLLEPITVTLLAYGALLGKEFNLDTVAAVTCMPAADVIRRLDEARQRHLVWIRPSESRYVFVHDQVRCAFLDRWDTSASKAAHQKVGDYLEVHASHEAAEIAFHFDAAGQPERAMPFAMLAAERFRHQHAFDMAEQQYRIANRAAADAETRFRILDGLGDMVASSGRYHEAIELLEAAEQQAHTDFHRASIRGKLAALAFKRGDMEAAIHDYEHSLQVLGIRLPSSGGRVLLGLLWEVLVQMGHTLFPTLMLHRRRRPASPEERLTLQMFSGLAHGCWYARSKSLAFLYHLRGLNRAERLRPTSELAQSYAEHAPGMTLVGYFSRALAYAEKSFRIREANHDLWGQAHSLHYHGCVLYAASRFQDCLDKCRRAIPLLERMGDYWQVHIARYQVAASHLHLGDLESACREAETNYRSGIELGDEQASGIILDIWVRAAEGRLPADILDRELRRPRHDVQGQCQVYLAAGIARLFEGQIQQAIQWMERAIRTAEQAGIHNAYTTPLYPWLATALRKQVEQYDGRTPSARLHLMKRALRAARRAIRASFIFRNDLPQAYREYALLQSMCGWRRRARRNFEKSLSLADATQASYQKALTLVEMGRIGLEFGWQDASRKLHQGTNRLQRFTPATLTSSGGQEGETAPRETLSLADRFDTVLEAGRRIAAAVAEPAIFEETRQAAQRLLRAEQCGIFRVQMQNGVLCCEPFGSQPWHDLDIGLIRKSIETGEVAVTEAEHPSASLPVLAAGRQGSILSVPIRVLNQINACLYVVHRHVSGVFGADERRLAAFVAAIAGAACESASAFRELQALNESLEERVAERTAAAETASRFKSQFLASMGHEIRSPMNGILGMAELALSTELTRAQRGYLNTVKRSGEALLTLLNDLLDLSKIEAGKMELESIEFPVQEIIQDATALMAAAAAQKGLELILDVAPNVPRDVRGDPNRLRQVLTNLLGNAIKFTHQGEVRVSVQSHLPSEGLADLYIAVSDTGIGIDPSQLGHVFEAFRQSDSSMTRRFGGTGLGLSISLQLVELMGGRIWAESIPNQGSTFHCMLPMTVTRPALPQDPQRLAGVALTIVSDCDSHAATLESLLQGHGAFVQRQRHAHWREAVASLASDRDSLLLLDYRPGDSLAVSLAPSVRQALEARGLAAVAFCPADRNSCDLQTAFPFFVLKPYGRAQLLDVVQLALGHSHALPLIVPTEVRDNSPVRTILLADDSAVNQEVAKGLLELRSHRVRCVSNGRQALSALECESFDVVLMDVEMPEMDGLEAAARIRAREQSTGSRIPIFAMTARSASEFSPAEQACFDGYIPKPIQPDVLFQVVEALVAYEAGKDPVTEVPAPSPIGRPDVTVH